MGDVRAHTHSFWRFWPRLSNFVENRSARSSRNERCADDGYDNWSEGSTSADTSVDIGSAPKSRIWGKAMSAKQSQNWLRTMTLVAGAAITCLGATGCQVAVNGQTLPSPYYLEDDVQYAPGAGEFKLAREAAALRAARAEEKLER